MSELLTFACITTDMLPYLAKPTATPANRWTLSTTQAGNNHTQRDHMHFQKKNTFSKE